MYVHLHTCKNSSSTESRRVGYSVVSKISGYQADKGETKGAQKVGKKVDKRCTKGGQKVGKRCTKGGQKVGKRRTKGG
jgi:hypothetical protein